MKDRTFDKNSLSWIALSLKERADLEIEYTGDLSDCGNEIGYMIGRKYENLSPDEIEDLILGIRHGISMTNGTH